MTSPTDAPTTGAPAAALTDPLQRVLAAEHAAVFGYPVIGVHLSAPDQASQARRFEAAHRLVRDAVADQLAAAGAIPVASAPSYQPPSPVTDPGSAANWAVELETGVAAAYRYLLVCCVRAGDDQLAARKQALTGLTSAAAAATYWRQLVTPSHPTEPFPGAG